MSPICTAIPPRYAAQRERVLRILKKWERELGAASRGTSLSAAESARRPGGFSPRN